jgi:hypothetical protein
VKEFKVAQLPKFEANTTCRVRPTKIKNILKKGATHNTTTHLINQQLIVRASPSKSSEGRYPMLD